MLSEVPKMDERHETKVSKMSVFFLYVAKNINNTKNLILKLT